MDKASLLVAKFIRAWFKTMLFLEILLLLFMASGDIPYHEPLPARLLGGTILFLIHGSLPVAVVVAIAVGIHWAFTRPEEGSL